MSGVNSQSQLSHLGALLVSSLQNIDAYEKTVAAKRKGETIHVPTVGSKVSTAYEQLRNASEYAEDDLLQQRAIRRYLKRVLSFHTRTDTQNLAQELVTELTQSEYLKNDYTPVSDVGAIAHQINRYYDAYWRYAETEHNATKRLAFQGWILDTLAVRCEQILKSHIHQLMFAHFAYSYIHDKLPIKKLVRPHENVTSDDHATVLYIAIHRALLKSDNATIRVALMDSYRKDINHIHDFESFNKTLDHLFETKTVAYVARVVGKNGAALRFIYTGFFREDSPMIETSLKSQNALEHGLRQHIDQEYTSLNRRLDRGIIKSVMFLLITKTIIGALVEIPYDYLVYGAIIWVPLIINLFFPAVFIAFSRLALSTPGPRNTDAVVDQVQTMLFAGNTDAHDIKIPRSSRSVGFNAAYAIMFMIMFAGLSYILYSLEFNIVQGIIFFIFLSTASFLSFRLSRQIQELEVIHTQGTLSLLRDILYMPFIYVGQQISYRYSKINLVAIVLDILIELPLKTVLRLIRQWMQFLNAKKDELI